MGSPWVFSPTAGDFGGAGEDAECPDFGDAKARDSGARGPPAHCIVAPFNARHSAQLSMRNCTTKLRLQLGSQVDICRRFTGSYVLISSSLDMLERCIVMHTGVPLTSSGSPNAAAGHNWYHTAAPPHNADHTDHSPFLSHYDAL